jgi:hypothetical protein
VRRVFSSGSARQDAQFYGGRDACRYTRSKEAASVIPAEFDFAAVLPAENNSLVIDNDELAGNKPRVVEYFLRDLPFAFESSKAGPPGRRPRRHIIVPGYLDRLDFVTALVNANHFIEMTGIVPDPLAC